MRGEEIGWWLNVHKRNEFAISTFTHEKNSCVAIYFDKLKKKMMKKCRSFKDDDIWLPHSNGDIQDLIISFQLILNCSRNKNAVFFVFLLNNQFY